MTTPRIISTFEGFGPSRSEDLAHTHSASHTRSASNSSRHCHAPPHNWQLGAANSTASGHAFPWPQLEGSHAQGLFSIFMVRSSQQLAAVVYIRCTTNKPGALQQGCVGFTGQQPWQSRPQALRSDAAGAGRGAGGSALGRPTWRGTCGNVESARVQARAAARD